MRHAIAAAVGCAGLVGCGTIVTTETLDLNDDRVSKIPGVIYTLPKELFPLTITQSTKLFSSPKDQSQIDKNNSSIKTLTTLVEKEKSAAKTRAFLDQISRLQRDNKMLLAKRTKRLGLSIDVGSPIVVPDRNARFMLKYEHDIMSDDYIVIKTDETGFLTEISTTSTDQTGPIIQQTVKLAVDSFVFGATGGLNPSQFVNAKVNLEGLDDKIPDKVSERSSCLKQFSVKVIIDPADVDGAEKIINAAVQSVIPGPFKDCIRLVALDESGQGLPTRDGDKTPTQIMAEQCGSGACYRRRGSVFLAVENTEDSNLKSGFKHVQAAQLGPVGSIDFSRRLFVTAKAKALFNKGMLTQVEYSDPSEVLGFISIPTNVLGEIFGIPSRLWSTQTSQVNAQKGLVEARSGLAASQAQLLKNQIELDALRQGGAAPEPATETPSQP